MNIAVCALTYKRPQGLARLLARMRELTFTGAQPALRMVVVDNDPEASARETCEKAAGSFPWPLCYAVEPQRGIAPARNTALDNVGDADWIAFIDDDESPRPNWLDALIRAQRDYEADVVTGPVEPILPQGAPLWIDRGAFLAGIRFPTGEVIDHAYTNNVLFRKSILSETKLRFDTRWALMGCEDLHFFRAMALAGYKIVWTNDAVVTESVPASRATARWILQRAFRYGNSDSIVERELYRGTNPRGHPLVRAAKRIIVGVVLLPVSWLGGKHRFMLYLRHLCYGVGMIAGWFGYEYEEYRSTHGS